MKRYKIALKSDSGIRRVSTVATDEQTARSIVCTVENAPLSAVKWCKEDTRKFWIEKAYTIWRKGNGYNEELCAYEYTREGHKARKQDLAEYRASGDRDGHYYTKTTFTRHSLALPV